MPIVRDREKVTDDLQTAPHVPGAADYFTVNLARRDALLLTERIDDLRNALPYACARHPVVTTPWSWCPNTSTRCGRSPDRDADHSLRRRLRKTWFSRQVPHGESRRDSGIASLMSRPQSIRQPPPA